ncbi:PREDICTED: formamidopyrimidine-DNA glycosylase isoform X2 [Brassica oleracea var. oleracea]|uniref:formamidopyrimidine-DNA glycosylase isoform X2 n=1 Tax=Brassica oleracea var. oleracea TaxID=109376 RepID=UPI0006A6DE43|nr:PREDICTED: formamidopyrimidine-DNA glycosylase isoform X2 [Brassica oleracea var. oleracea]
MPELPEVEAARRAIEDNCLGKKINRVLIADDNKVIDGISPSDFQNSILGKTIVSARRKGKNLWLELDSPPFPSFQFGMAGAIYIKGVAVTKYKRSAVKDSEEWPSKYSKFFVELDDGLELSFTDKRRFAKVRLLENPVSVRPISELGPDALLEPITVDEFAKSLAKKKITIKPLLLDQGFISGIGNWIADEVLYQARIHPLQTASSLSKEQCEALHTSIKEVIEKAVEVDAESSQFPSNWIFHAREEKPGKAFVDGLSPVHYNVSKPPTLGRRLISSLLVEGQQLMSQSCRNSLGKMRRKQRRLNRLKGVQNQKKTMKKKNWRKKMIVINRRIKNLKVVVRSLH